MTVSPIPVWSTEPGTVTKLRLSGNTVLDSSGYGTVLLTPQTANTEWRVYSVTVRTNQGATQTPFPQAELFDSITPVPSASYGATGSGHNDWFEAPIPIEIGSNDGILVVWTGGIPGTTATARIRGKKILRGV